ncbi:MAG TPA: hypothetical protein VLA00_16365 [Xanthobacteraceae bacterium]|nr:hypothetical protein [Xanthobacteraceae bacterium]
MTEQTITKAELARRLGLARSRITQLVQHGMPVTDDGRIVEAEARRWIDANLDRHRREARKPGAGTSVAVSDLRGEKLRRESALLDLEFKRKTGELVDRSEAERILFERARFERDAWTGWAARAAASVAAESGGSEAAVFATLDRLVREHLAELAGTPLHDRRSA